MKKPVTASCPNRIPRVESRVVARALVLVFDISPLDAIRNRSFVEYSFHIRMTSHEDKSSSRFLSLLNVSLSYHIIDYRLNKFG